MHSFISTFLPKMDGLPPLVLIEKVFADTALHYRKFTGFIHNDLFSIKRS